MWMYLSLDIWLEHNFFLLNWTKKLSLRFLRFFTQVHLKYLLKFMMHIRKSPFFFFFHFLFLFILLFLSSIVTFPLPSEFLSLLSYRHWCSLHWPSERWALPQLKPKTWSVCFSYILNLSSNSLELISPPRISANLYSFDLVIICSNVIQIELKLILHVFKRGKIMY